MDPKNTFDTFIVSLHNRMMYAAAQAVAERPGQAYNPLLLYGSNGVGKTHILHAIGHEVLCHSPNLTVRYQTCDSFTDDLIMSIRNNRMMEFRKRYRQIDLLLIDDIQFIVGRESTQEEFYHLFNALKDKGRQIVLASDRPLKLFSRLEERLRSRFAGGLAVQVQAPDLEARLAILRSKSEREGLVVPDNILLYIASSNGGDVRDLEAALVQISAGCSLTDSSSDLNNTSGSYLNG